MESSSWGFWLTKWPERLFFPESRPPEYFWDSRWCTSAYLLRDTARAIDPSPGFTASLQNIETLRKKLSPNPRKRKPQLSHPNTVRHGFCYHCFAGEILFFGLSAKGCISVAGAEEAWLRISFCYRQERFIDEIGSRVRRGLERPGKRFLRARGVTCFFRRLSTSQYAESDLRRWPGHRSKSTAARRCAWWVCGPSRAPPASRQSGRST